MFEINDEKSLFSLQDDITGSRIEISYSTFILKYIPP